MIADPDTLLAALYVELTDRIIPLRGPGRRGPGRPPQVTDAELACLAVAQVLLRCDDERYWLCAAPRLAGHLFPRPLAHSEYNTRLRQLAPLMEAALRWLADATPATGYGYCASHSRWYWGCKLLLMVDLLGPLRCAIEARDQCVASCGISSKVAVITSSTATRPGCAGGWRYGARPPGGQLPVAANQAPVGATPEATNTMGAMHGSGSFTVALMSAFPLMLAGNGPVATLVTVAIPPVMLWQLTIASKSAIVLMPRRLAGTAGLSAKTRPRTWICRRPSLVREPVPEVIIHGSPPPGTMRIGLLAPT